MWRPIRDPPNYGFSGKCRSWTRIFKSSRSNNNYLMQGRLLCLWMLLGHPAFTGTQGMVANMQKKKSGRRTWTLQLTVETPEKKVATPHNHPLNSVNQRGREESRLQTLAEVLAAIAKRRTNMGVTDGSDNCDLAY